MDWSESDQFLTISSISPYKNYMRIVVLTKRQYTNKDLIDDQYGRLWEIPMALTNNGDEITGSCLSYKARKEGLYIRCSENGNRARWYSINSGRFVVFGCVKYIFVTIRLIWKTRPDVIWSCSDTFYCVFGYLLSRVFKCKSVLDLYDNFESFASYRVPILGWLFRYSVRYSDGVTSVSEPLKKYVVRKYRRTKHIAIVTNAVDKKVFYKRDKAKSRKKLGLPQDAIIIGAAGDLSQHRGSDIIFQSIENESRLPHNVHIAVCGYRNSDTTIPESNRVHDLGQLPTNDVPIFLSALDLAIVYNRESSFGDYCFPQKLYEILACQCPIIAANVGVVGHILKDKPHLLYTNGDIEEFVNAVRLQLSSQELLEIDIPIWKKQADQLHLYMKSLFKSK